MDAPKPRAVTAGSGVRRGSEFGIGRLVRSRRDRELCEVLEAQRAQAGAAMFRRPSLSFSSRSGCLSPRPARRKETRRAIGSAEQTFVAGSIVGPVWKFFNTIEKCLSGASEEAKLVQKFRCAWRRRAAVFGDCCCCHRICPLEGFRHANMSTPIVLSSKRSCSAPERRPDHPIWLTYRSHAGCFGALRLKKSVSQARKTEPANSSAGIAQLRIAPRSIIAPD